MTPRAHTSPVAAPPPQRTASIVLKLYLLTATVALFAWAAMLPDDDSDPPAGWTILLVSILLGAIALLVLRLRHLTAPLLRPFAHQVRRVRGTAGPPVGARTRVLLDRVGVALDVIWVVGFALVVLAVLAVVAVAVIWDGSTVPVALVVAPFGLVIAGRLGLWLIGRAHFPDFGG